MVIAITSHCLVLITEQERKENYDSSSACYLARHTFEFRTLNISLTQLVPAVCFLQLAPCFCLYDVVPWDILHCTSADQIQPACCEVCWQLLLTPVVMTQVVMTVHFSHSLVFLPNRIESRIPDAAYFYSFFPIILCHNTA